MSGPPNRPASALLAVLLFTFLLMMGGCSLREGSSEQQVVPEVVRTNLFVAPNGSDANPGTQEEPFRTIARAAQVVTSGTTVYVAPGQYTGGFRTNANGTPDARIIFVSSERWGAKIVPPLDSRTASAWDNRGSYVDIVGFDVDGTQYQSGTKWLSGIYNAGSYNNIRHNHVHHIALDIPCEPDRRLGHRHGQLLQGQAGRSHRQQRARHRPRRVPLPPRHPCRHPGAHLQQRRLPDLGRRHPPVARRPARRHHRQYGVRARARASSSAAATSITRKGRTTTRSWPITSSSTTSTASSNKARRAATTATCTTWCSRTKRPTGAWRRGANMWARSRPNRASSTTAAAAPRISACAASRRRSDAASPSTRRNRTSRASSARPLPASTSAPSSTRTCRTACVPGSGELEANR